MFASLLLLLNFPVSGLKTGICPPVERAEDSSEEPAEDQCLTAFPQRSCQGYNMWSSDSFLDQSKASQQWRERHLKREHTVELLQARFEKSNFTQRPETRLPVPALLLHLPSAAPLQTPTLLLFMPLLIRPEGGTFTSF